MGIAHILRAPTWVFNNRFLLFNWWRFKKVGKGVRIINPLKIDGIGSITLGDGVIINDGTWLAAMPMTGKSNVELVISDGSCIGHYNHIYSTSSIVIERDVLIADKVYISDNLHSYENITLPIIKQQIKQCNKVVIGEGSWLGENVCVIGASVGKHCVIGANSVVTKNIPDYCVAVGIPAKVIKTYDTISQRWISCPKD